MTEEEGGRDWDWLKPKYVKWAIVAVIIIVALAIAIPLIQQELRAPRITLTDLNTSHDACGFFGPPQTFGWSFSLVNTGDADGFAVVWFELDRLAIIERTYLVRQGETVDRVESLSVGDCLPHDIDARIIQVRET